MVLGTSKNIDLGLAWVLEGADRGCIKARALCRRLFHLYNKKFERSGEIQRQWLYEGSVNGSVIALEDLGHFYAESHEYRAAVREIKFSFNLEGAKALRYHEHILPRFDLSNSNILLELAKKAKIRSESGGLENDGAKQEANHDIKSMFLGNWGTYFDQLYYYGTLLHLACLFGFADSVEILLGAGLDIEESNSSPKLRTPLLCALRRGHHEIAKLLIERGADCRPFPARDPYVIFTPSPLHYLVYIEDEDAAVELAELIAIRGGDVNNMCKSSTLDTSDLWSLVGSYSTTPLRWAVMHGKAKLVRKLLSLGARFATSRLWKSGDTPTSKITSDTEFCLLLETPCTNLEILALFFDQLKSFKLPLEFAQTPLGLLVSEDDTPHRRLRLGFSSPAAVIAALDVLLNLHPGYEDVVLWSVVRHGHLDLAEHLIRHKHWSLELRWSGLTPLQTAVLYGHKYLVEFLLLQGADPKAVTLKRELTCLHLLMLVPRDHQTDLDIMESLLPYSIDINAAERCDELTALHIGVRNKKLHLVSVLLAHGANPDIPVRDQLELLAEGRSGLLKNSTSRPTQLVKDVTIIGEVLLQCNQDNVYPLDYVEKLLKLFLSTDTDKGFLPTSQIYVDSEKTTSILHLMALITLPNSFRIFELALSRFGKELVDIPDLHRDTPLHYACSSRQANNVDALIKLGADPFCTSYTGLTPFETMIYSSLILGPSICGFRNESVDDPENESKEPRNRSGRRISPMQIFEFDKEYNERFRIRQGLKIPCIREVYSVFEANNLRTENPLKELAAAWSPLTGNGEELYLSVTPLKHVHSNTETETGGNSNALTGAVDISDDTQCLPGLDPAQALSNSTIRKVALDQHQHFKMHLTDSPDFMICDHENYDWKDLERDSHDFYGKGKQILIPKKLTGGRPIFEIYGSIDWCGISE
jgi:ankyrin repeat protein